MICVSMLCIAFVLSATQSAPDRLPVTADQIIANHIEARGGREAIARVHSVVFRGTYSEPGFETPRAVMALMRPYYKLVGDPGDLSNDFREGYDGSAWEFYGDPGIVLRTVGAAAAAARHHADIDGPLVDYRSKGSTVTLVGMVSVDGRAAYCLRVRMQDGFEEDELVDAESWLLIASRKAAPIHAFGADVRSETRFSDFRAVGGVLYPFSIREVDLATGKQLNQMKYSSIEINTPIDVTAFSPPARVLSPLQQLLEQLYAERSDAASGLWSYRDFRRAHPDVDTDRGLQFVGYQMLKMGDVAGATALLEINASEHPASSGAAFGVGRAYAASGQVERARAEFRRAVELDPKNTRAASALAALPPK